MIINELVNELIDLLNGPHGHMLTRIAHEDNLYSLIETLLDEYGELLATLDKISRMADR